MVDFGAGIAHQNFGFPNSIIARMHGLPISDFQKMPLLPPCPNLPVPSEELDWRALAAHRDAHRGAAFYRDCLEYGNYLWQRTLPARAILCLDRAFGAELGGDDPVLAEWPMPYAAVVWMLRHSPPGVFIGNPRVHFQHYAGRMNEPRREQRRWRSWACWALSVAVFPDLPGDPRHVIREPSIGEIEAKLREYGFPGEAELWLRILPAK